MGSEPAFGAIFAVWWLGEDIGPLGWLGGSLIVIASLAMSTIGSVEMTEAPK